MSRRSPALGLLVLCAACQGPLAGLGELPEEPIALYYRGVEDARRLAEARREEQGPAAPPRTQRGERAVARLEAIAEYLERVAGVDPGGDEGDPVPGRLSLLDVRSLRVAPVAAARPGAVPMDWDAERRRLLFSQVEGRRRQLFELDRERGEVHPVTRGPRAHPAGCYGPGDRKVLMVGRLADDGVETWIELSGPGGVGGEAISPGPHDHSPACAPDGSSAAWVRRDERDREQVVVRRLEPGAQPRVLAPGRDPTYSSDGRWIVFSAPVGDGWELYRVRPDGSGRARLGRGALDEFQPALSPDGRLVVYVAEDDFRRRLYVRGVDGANDRLLFEEGDSEHPVW